MQGKCVIQTADLGYAIAGVNATSPGLGVLLKTDAFGEVLWEKTYSNIPNSVVQTTDSGYALFGDGGWMAKTDSEGTVLWERTFEPITGCDGFQSGDGGYVLTGYMPDSNGGAFTLLLKIDESGDMMWNKTFTGDAAAHAVTEAYDGGYAFAGNLKNDFWFAKTDSNGELQWSQTYSYGAVTDSHFVYSLAKTTDGGYVLAGYGDWQVSGGYVPWLVKTDSQGHEVWNQPYEDLPNSGFVSVVQTGDGGFAAVVSNLALLVKVDALGKEQWSLTYADVTQGIPFASSSVTRTNDGGYAVVGASRSDTWLVKVSSELNSSPLVVTILSPENKTYAPGNLPLTFKVSQPTSWVGYSLDGHDNVTLTGNTTLTGLADGTHTLIIYALDAAGINGASETITFSVAAPFPTGWVVLGVVAAAVVCVGLLVYFKRKSLRGYFTKGSLRGLATKQRVTAIASNKIIMNLIVIILCIMFILVQLFFPYYYYSSTSRNSSSPFQVGISYVYEGDSIGQIFGEVSRIKSLGFQIIRVDLVCDSKHPNDYSNSLTDVFFSATQHFNMSVALIIQNHNVTDEIQYYLGRWGKYLSYVQILNEPELSSSWDVGALFTDDELISKFQQVYSAVTQYRLPVQLYTNFGAGFVVRTNIPIQLSKNLDFVGYDVFMDSFLVLSPDLVQLLHKITNKDVMITEFGMSTSDDTAQSNYLIKGLNLFKNMGLKGCWLVYWNSVDNCYGIRGRLAEKTVGEWIAKNA